MAKGGRPGGSSVSVTSANRALSKNKASFAEGNAPKTITVNGVTLTGGKTGQYESNGGYTVHSYKYTASSAITKDGRTSISFRATSYKASNGTKARGYERRGARVFGTEITGTNLYTWGSSGGIGQRSGSR